MIAKPTYELTVSSAPSYLASRGFDPASLKISELAGGVSNIVLLVEHPGGRLVLKQALPQLRVEQEWFSDMRRIFAECAALRAVAPLLPAGSVPEVLFEDEPFFAFAMTAAPAGAQSWKTQLLAGAADDRIASQVAAILGALIRNTWQSPEMAARFDNLQIFDELRLDPYYRRMQSIAPDLAPHFEMLIENCRKRRVSLVHGDWSPKNILAHDGRAIAIDFEVIHFGDPSFDAAFMLNHLLLKTFHGLPDTRRLARVFWDRLTEEIPQAPWFEQATLQHLAGLLLARMDGKSPAEYLRDPGLKERVRRFGRKMIQDPPATVDEVWERHAAGN